MLIVWEYLKTKMKKIGSLERMLHCVKIDKFKKMTLYVLAFFRIIVKWEILSKHNEVPHCDGPEGAKVLQMG